MRQLSGDDEVLKNLYFPNVPRTMQNLLIHGTFLDDVTQFVNDITEENPTLLIVVYFIILVSAMTLMNMLVGVLVEVIQAVASTENESMTILYVKECLLDIMAQSDSDKDGHISKKEFDDLIMNRRTLRLLG